MFGSRYTYGVPERRVRLEEEGPVVVARRPFVSRLFSLVNLVFGVIYTIIGIRIVLEVLGASEGNRFKMLVDRLSAPLLGMFENLLPSWRIGNFELPLSYLFALVIYALIHFVIQRVLLALTRPRAY
jgi:uncharacterized protein YggT (Ycf19 family)